MKKRDNILRLKYRLEPKENDMVEFQILEQDEKLYENKHQVIGNYLGWDIISSNLPMIRPGNREIFLRGTAGFNLRTDVFKGHHLTPSIHKALEEMVKHVYGNCTVVKG